MATTDPNRLDLRRIAHDLGSLREEVVFVGGATVGLFIVDPAAPAVRPTKDVDVIIEVSTRSEYDHRIREALRARGFSELVGENIPACAWHKGGIRLDVMPTDEKLLGFSNRWYEAAIKHSKWIDLDGISIRVVSPPYFLATKLEAFKERGEGDFHGSHDLEDVIAVLDGRASIVDEVSNADTVVRDFITETFQNYLQDPGFLNALPGHVVDPGRDNVVLDRLSEIA